MGAAYAQDLRDRVLAAYDCGMATKQIATLFQVSSSWARRVKQRRRELGETRPRPMGGATIFKIDLTRLAELVDQQPDATRPGLRQRLGVQCTDAAIYLALRRLGLSFKKNTPRGRTDATGRRRAARELAARAVVARHPATDLPRRNLGQDQHDALTWPRAARSAFGGSAPIPVPRFATRACRVQR